MERRNALKLVGALVVCFCGKAVATNAYNSSSVTSFESWNIGPVDYVFRVDEIKNLIIERKEKQDLVIPFSEIIEALEE